MYEIRRSNSKLVHGWGLGLPILVVDLDTTSLMFLASMLEQYSYKVTTTEVVSVAMSMIEEGKESYKLVMANIDMDAMNSLSFLRLLIKKDIPFILMSSETSKNVAKKAIAYGACLHLQKPISLNDLKYLWQHVHRNDKDCMTKTRSCGKEFRAAKIDDAATKPKPKPADVARNDQFNCITRLKKTRMQRKGSSSKTKRSYDDDDDEEKRNDKRIKSKHDPTDSERRETTGTKSKQSSSSRLVWDKELHHKFIAAVNALGDKNARPKSILRMMNEPNLSLRQVASHLQKYKAQVRRNLSSLTNASTSVYDKPGSFSMLLKNKSVLSTHPGHKSSKFSIGDSTAPIGSIYQNQQFQNVAQNMQEKLHATLDSTDSFSPLNQTDQLQSMPPYKHQKLNFSVGSDLINSANQTLQLPSLPHYIHQKRNCIPDSTATSISLSQSQVLMSPIQTTQGIDLVVAEYTGKPEAVEPQSETICGNLGVDTTIHNTVPSAIISENQKQNSAELADLVNFLMKRQMRLEGHVLNHIQVRLINFVNG